ncbi:hypothetical protein F53441_12705 [Fusarium austroafricanum]|uniref:Uncharacterized protein n=1 Tax=Fusarium austroafricanum TaxID=2364996 RepID=A0A8H4NI92_9HYPO|nr:hypothetical protein F53441_12705 [Fusarium austroafricanum]
MHIFIETAKGLSSSSGGLKANISLLRCLSSKGHCVCQLCYSYCEEIGKYMQAMADSIGHDLRLCTKVLHLRSEDGESGTDVNVRELVMDDGIEVVAVDSKSFDAAFGDKVNIYMQIPRMTAEYMKIGTSSVPLLDFIFFLQGEVRRFTPTHLMFNEGLSMQVNLSSELARLGMSRIAVVHMVEQLPFGPISGGVHGRSITAREGDLPGHLDGIWSVSNAIKMYALDVHQLQTHHPGLELSSRGELRDASPSPRLGQEVRRHDQPLCGQRVQGFHKSRQSVPTARTLAYMG